MVILWRTLIVGGLVGITLVALVVHALLIWEALTY
jgi:hypothetical protein